MYIFNLKSNLVHCKKRPIGYESRTPNTGQENMNSITNSKP